MAAGTERNIFNLVQMDAWLEDLFSHIGGREDIRLWVRRNLRNYLLREYEQLQVLETLPHDAPLWAKRDFAKGRVIQRVCLGPVFRGQIAHVLDLFLAKPWLRLERLSVSDALLHAQRWDAELSRQVAVAEDLRGIRPVILYDNGWSWVQVLSKDALHREGAKMNHCVGSYYGRANVKIFSLRDKDNMPHVTLEVTATGALRQAKRNGNRRIDRQCFYRGLVFHFLQHQQYTGKFLYGFWDIEGSLVLPDGRFADFEAYKQLWITYWQVHAGEAATWLTQLSRWTIFTKEQGRELWQSLLEVIEKDGQLSSEGTLPLVLQQLRQILFSKMNYKQDLYGEMVVLLLGERKLHALPERLSEEELLEFLKDEGFFSFCLEKHVSADQALGIPMEQFESILSKNRELCYYLLPEQIEPEWLASAKVLAEYLRHQPGRIIYEPASDVERYKYQLRQLIFRKLGLGREDVFCTAKDMEGLLAVLFPQPQQLPAALFREEESPTILAAYWNQVLPSWQATDLEKGKWAAAFLQELGWPRERFEAFIAGLAPEAAASILVTKEYATRHEVEQDLWRLGFSLEYLEKEKALDIKRWQKIPYLEEASLAAPAGGLRPKYAVSRLLPALWVLYRGKSVLHKADKTETADQALDKTIAAMCCQKQFFAEDLYRINQRELAGVVRSLSGDKPRKIASLLPFLSAGAKEALLSGMSKKQRSEIEELTQCKVAMMRIDSGVAMDELMQRVCVHLDMGEIRLQSDDARFWGDTVLASAWSSLEQNEKLLVHKVWRIAGNLPNEILAETIGSLDAKKQRCALLALPYRLRQEVDDWLQKNGQQQWQQAWFLPAPERYLQYLRVLACALGNQLLLDGEKETVQELEQQRVQPFLPPVLKKVCVADVPEILNKIVAAYFQETLGRTTE